jgi:multiple sugar transport system substrate-binding protein
VGIPIALVTTTLNACGGIAQSGKDVTLHMIATDYSGLKTGSPMESEWGDLTRAFEQRNPHIKVEVQLVPIDKVDAQVAQQVKDGNAPDIAQLDTYSGFADKDQLYTTDDLFPISMQSEFIPSLADAGSVNRIHYGIPWVASTRMFFYNKKLFAHAGIKSAPETWEDVKRDAVKLKADGVRVPIALPLGPQEAEAESMMWMLGNGGGYTNPVGAYTLDSARNVYTFNWLKDNLVDAGLVGPRDPAKTSVSDAFGDFISGRAAMLNGHLTLLPRAKAAGIDVGVVPLPGKAQPSAQTLGNADWMMAFKQNGHLDADAKFLRYVYSEPNMLKFQQQYKLLPVTADVADVIRTNPQYRDLVPFMTLLPDAAFCPVDKKSWGAVSEDWKEAIGQAVHGDPAKVLSTLPGAANAADSHSGSDG